MSFKINFAAAETINAEFTATESTTTEEMVEMTNTTATEVNAIELVEAAGLTNAGAIRLFLMETKGITIPVIKAGIEELGYEVPTGKKLLLVRSPSWIMRMFSPVVMK
jgi:hypothetical protein